MTSKSVGRQRVIRLFSLFWCSLGVPIGFTVEVGRRSGSEFEVPRAYEGAVAHCDKKKSGLIKELGWSHSNLLRT